MRLILAISLLFFSLTGAGQLYQEPLLMIPVEVDPDDTTNAVWDAATKGTTMYVSANGDTAVNTSGCARAYSTFSTGDTAKVFSLTRIWTSAGNMAVGISSILTSPNCTYVPPADTSQLIWIAGALYNSTTPIVPNNMTAFAAGDTIMVAIDYKNGALYMGKNGVWEKNTANVTGVPTSGAARTGALISWTPDGRRYYMVCGVGPPNQYILNTGKYTGGIVRNPPTGYRWWLNPAPD